MWNSLRVLSIIPARGGSRRLPGKNLRSFAGAPLIEWSIRLSLQLECVDETVVTSEDPAILEVAAKAGAQAVQRPPELATDEASSLSVVLHALEQQKKTPDIVVLLQPTSPLRSAEDVLGTLKCLDGRTAGGAVSVSEKIKHPEWSYLMSEDGSLVPLRERSGKMDSSRIVGINGAVYAVHTEWLLKHRSFLAPGVVGYLMPAERSVDIDVLEEFDEAEKLFVESNPQTPMHE